MPLHASNNKLQQQPTVNIHSIYMMEHQLWAAGILCRVQMAHLQKASCKWHSRVQTNKVQPYHDSKWTASSHQLHLTNCLQAACRVADKQKLEVYLNNTAATSLQTTSQIGMVVPQQSCASTPAAWELQGHCWLLMM